MDFSLSDDQQLLKESVERFIERDYDFNHRQAASRSDDGFNRDTWATFAELGWLGATLPEAYGGTEGGGVETMVLMEALGHGLVVEPILPSVILGGGIVRHAGSEDQKQALLPAMAEGSKLLAFGYAEPQSRYDLHDVALTATKDGDGYILNGQKSVVLNGDTADTLIVSARTSGERRDKDGISLFVVDRGADGLDVRGYPTVDGQRAAELGFDGVRLGTDALLGAEDQALGAIEQVIDDATAAVCAEALGIMAVLNDTTLEYLKTREQFGKKLGEFQALQHRMVDMFVAREESIGLVNVASMRIDDDGDQERKRCVSAAKVQIGRAGRLVGQEAIQLHGGIAMTDEYKVGHYFKRISMIGRLFGDLDHHLDRFITL
jgi:pimeloyl-CoA dehydrogenase small subunit